MRADARRNYERLVSVAGEVLDEEGADGSLERVAKRAGVGIGTLYRHFPTRQDLIAAVYRSQIETLCAQAAEFAATLPPERALQEWLRVFVAYLTRSRGLKDSLDAETPALQQCKTEIHTAGGTLLANAKQAGAIRQDLELVELFRLMHALSIAAPDQPDRMLALAMEGLTG